MACTLTLKCRRKATGVARGRCDHEDSTGTSRFGAGTLRWRVPLPSGKLCHFAAFLHKDTRAAVSGRSSPTPGEWLTFSYFEPPGLNPRARLSSSMPLASTPLPTPLSVAAALGFWGRGSSGSARAPAGAASSRYSPSMGGASAEDQ